MVHFSMYSYVNYEREREEDMRVHKEMQTQTLKDCKGGGQTKREKGEAEAVTQ